MCIRDSFGAVGTTAADIGFGAFAQMGVLYKGLEVLSHGAILSGLLMGAVAVFVIERQYRMASSFALAAAVLSYFGFIHGATVGIGNGLGMAPSITVAYLAVAAILYWCNGLPKSDNQEDTETAL